MIYTHLLSKGNWLAAHKTFIKEFNAEIAILISYLADQQDQRKGWFYCTYERIENDLGFSVYSIRKNVQHLIKNEIILSKKMGLPAKVYYLLNETAVIQIFNKTTPQDLKDSGGLEIKDSGGHHIKENIVNQNHKKKLTKKVKKVLIMDQFDSFYKAYPKKVGKLNAVKAFEKLTKTKTPPKLKTLLKAIEHQKQSTQWENSQYIPHPATWLNRGGWEDVLEQADTPVNRTGNNERFSDGVEYYN